ncbi:glycosyltransferase [Flagellimonas pelagia]|uniref:Glycosyltransferase n=1 Tax=Flagellimonas pelagia TaxID=2306998 RepID=A0A3A1NJI3_9FLAO|nr:glycosyltransferase [Allomuricauda maritima]RIV46045.1 glycosyltransferase [Allomuricauda maritima]TXJ98814.1 glycosyltransferase [Allomuricauda maritima]
MKEITIVHLITGLGGGGAEQMVLKLGLEAEKHKVKTLVIAISDIDTIEGKFKDAGLEYHFLNISSFSSIGKGLKKLRDILKEEKNPVMHCHMFHALAIGILFKLLYRRLPIVFTLHNTTVNQAYRAFVLAITKSLRKADILFSKSGTQWFLKNTVIIPNGLDISNFEVAANERNGDLAGKTFHFLFLGSLTEQKNPFILPKLAGFLRSKGLENFVIDVLGEGSLRKQLEEKIKAEGQSEKIVLHGFSNKAVDYLKSSDCLIMPSLWEGMPVVILEAGAARLPIICTPVGSIPDIVPEENGYVVEMDRFPQAMAYVMEDYPTALQKSNRFYDHVVANYSIQEVFNRHLELYREVSEK